MVKMMSEIFCSKRVSGVVAFFDDENKLLEAAKKTYLAGYRKFDAITPFPVHGMDDAMGLKRSWLPWVTFIGGLTGLLCALLLQGWTSSSSWPLNIGGKPLLSWPAFIPITFELTVLFGALSTVAVLFVVCGLPKVDPPIIDPDLTSHKFALFVPENDIGYEVSKVESFFKGLGSKDVRKVAEF